MTLFGPGVMDMTAKYVVSAGHIDHGPSSERDRTVPSAAAAEPGA